MRLGKRTEKLVREAAVAGFVQGTRWAGWHPLPGVPSAEDAFPLDPEIWLRARRCAEKFPDLYPTLSKVVDAEFTAAVAAHETASAAALVELLAAPPHRVGAP